MLLRIEPWWTSPSPPPWRRRGTEARGRHERREPDRGFHLGHGEVSEACAERAPPGPATPDGQGRLPGRRRGDSGRRRRGGPLGAHPRRRSRGSSAGSSGKRCLPCWWWARRGREGTDLMESRGRPRLRRKGTAELLAQRAAERLSRCRPDSASFHTTRDIRRHARLRDGRRWSDETRRPGRSGTVGPPIDAAPGARSCRDQQACLPPLDTSGGADFAGSSRRRIVSSISSFRALANEIAVPMIANPALRSTLSDLTLSLAARANRGRARNRFQEQGERPAGDALPPEGPADPVCDLGIAINDEAGDAAGEPSIDGDRTGGRLRAASGPQPQLPSNGSSCSKHGRFASCHAADRAIGTWAMVTEPFRQARPTASAGP